MNSLMQSYYNQATPICAAGRNVEVCCAADVNHAAAVFSTSSSLLFSRRHQQLSQAHHCSSPLPSQSNCSYPFLGDPNMSQCRHCTPLSAVFADAMMQPTSFSRRTSTKLSPQVAYSANSEHQPHTDVASNYEDCRHQLYESSLVAGLSGGTYKLEKLSPASTPNAEQRQSDATEMWNSRAHYINNISEQHMSTVEDEQRNRDCQASEKDNDLAQLDDDMDVSVTPTSTTMTTTSVQHQQEMSNKRSCDVKQTQLAVVCPIYPWMTRVHSTHGQSHSLIHSYFSYPTVESRFIKSLII